MPKKIKGFALEDTLVDSHFAMATTTDPVTLTTVANPAFATLVAKLGVLPGGPYDYAWVSTNSMGSNATVAVGATLAGLNGIISTGNGKTDIDLSLSTGMNLVMAGNGNDSVTGGLGADNIAGGNGKDELFGGEANDVINGGTGKDTMVGGLDTGTFSSTTDPATLVTTTAFVAGDVLTGGQGPDSFEYLVGDGVDEITDFKIGQDQLTLSGISETDVVAFTDGIDLYVGFSDGAGGVTADSVIRLDGLTDVDALLNSQSLLFA